MSEATVHVSLLDPQDVVPFPHITESFKRTITIILLICRQINKCLYTGLKVVIVDIEREGAVLGGQ